MLNNATVKHLIHSLTRFAPVWIGTAALFGVLALVYAFLFKSDTWVASQQLVVRNEATGSGIRDGKFSSETEKKAAQEIVLEMAKNRKVVTDALLAIGPESNWFGSSKWPSIATVDSVAKNNIIVHAPSGVEFGTTDVIYLDTKQSTPERSIAFNKAVCDALEKNLKEFRVVRATSVIEELETTRKTAAKRLDEATMVLQKAERAAGPDLADLRSMTEIAGSASNSRLQLDQVKLEIRTAETDLGKLGTTRKLLAAALENPSEFLVAPGELITAQPGLKRLREGLVDAQLRASEMVSRYTSEHPALIAGRRTVLEIEDKLIQELKTTLEHVDEDARNRQTRITKLEQQQTQLEERLNRLADVRASYANLVADVKNRSQILESIERDLAEARARRDSSYASSLVSRIAEPEVGDTPDGPGRVKIVIICVLAGLVTGVGLVLMISPPPAVQHGRRASDHQQQQPRESYPVDRRQYGAGQVQNRSTTSAARPESLANKKRLGDLTVDQTEQLSTRKPVTYDELIGDAEPVEINDRRQRPRPVKRSAPVVNLGIEPSAPPQAGAR